MAVVAPQGDDFHCSENLPAAGQMRASGAGGAVSVRRSSAQNPDDETAAGSTGRVVVISWADSSDLPDD